MTGNRRNRVAQHPGNDVPRFAPNFTVYLLPGDVVCLYSEDRKFFLHGELYCALASAIGEGGRTFRQLVSELERKFPTDKIEEALTRLLDRRFIVGKRHAFLDTVAAYWASLGLSPQDAEKQSQTMPRAHSIARREGRDAARRRLAHAGRSPRETAPPS